VGDLASWNFDTLSRNNLIYRKKQLLGLQEASGIDIEGLSKVLWPGFSMLIHHPRTAL
jgi:hypothetical protein